jgi:hypothetical protein
MRLDMKALLMVLVASNLLTLVVLGIAVASVFGLLSQETAVKLGSAVAVFGGLALSFLFGRRLLARDRVQRESTQKDPPPDPIRE